MLKVINNILKKKKYTCNCCGYKTLTDNDEGSICPVCFWEEEYFFPDDLFGFSGYNSITLYEAQENYKKFSCCSKRLMKHCRKPLADEEKDNNWLSIQDVIENKYSSSSQIIDELQKLRELLKQNYAHITYGNFKALHEIAIFTNTEGFEFREENGQFKNELVFKSFSIALYKKDFDRLLKLFEECYKKGMDYYISWSILLVVILEVHQSQRDDSSLTEILLDIENNNFYGIKSLESKLNEYWRRYKQSR